MSLGITGYLALQAILLGWCLQLTGGGVSWQVVFAGFAVERALTVLPLTPGGIGVADLGLVGVLLALGGDPAGVAAGAVLYRAFVFAIEIPVGGGALALWLFLRRRTTRKRGCRLAGSALPRHDATDLGLGSGAHIVHVTDVFLPRLGGIETHVDDLARHQRARGLDAHVLTPPAAGAGDEPAWVRRLPVQQARAELIDYDVVHVHLSMFSPYGLRMARAASEIGIPTLVTVHSMWAGAGAIVRFAARASLRSWPVAWSAVSGAAAASFERALGRSVAVLPNAVDVSHWRTDAAASSEVATRGDDARLTVVSVMRLMPRKRPLQLLRIFEAARQLVPDIELVIVGDGPLRRRLERYVARHGLDEVVRFTGRVPREHVLDELRAATLYVAPAPKESFGLAALEARCAGLPVIAHRRSGIGEFITDRVDGVLIDDDAQMTVAIAELASDAELRNRLAEHNRRVAPRQDWSHALDRTTELYRVAALAAVRDEDVPADAPALSRAVRA
jgi:glycosyltransferase involved in cell wall biosynthesis